MMKLMRSRRNQKGFTLVELIVVLVILGILAAVVAPNMVGWINKSREAQYLMEAQAVYKACQTELSGAYGRNVGIKDADDATTYLNYDGTGDNPDIIGNIKKLSGIATISELSIKSLTENAEETVGETYGIAGMEVTFTSKNGGVIVKATYANNAWSFEESEEESEDETE